ncbi:unnamed protein product, partial [Phaeothamnion confervicola]
VILWRQRLALRLGAIDDVRSAIEAYGVGAWLAVVEVLSQPPPPAQPPHLGAGIENLSGLSPVMQGSQRRRKRGDDDDDCGCDGGGGVIDAAFVSEVLESLGEREGACCLRCPWQRASALVSLRKARLRGGHAFFAARHLPIVLATEFRRRLRGAVDVAARASPGFLRDERVAEALADVRRAVAAYLTNFGARGADEGASAGLPPLTLAALDGSGRGGDGHGGGHGGGNSSGSGGAGTGSSGGHVAATAAAVLRHFPLCMRVMWQALAERHHLKYRGRLQLLLFLRGCGLPVADAVALWRRELQRRLGEATYRKKGYEYSVRHLYGLEGSGRQASLYSCDKMISDGPPPTPEHVHGCPFAHAAPSTLRAALASSGLPAADIEDVAAAAGGGSGGAERRGGAGGGGGGGSCGQACAQDACRLHFERLQRDTGIGG